MTVAAVRVSTTARWTGPVLSLALAMSAFARGADFLQLSVTPLESLLALGLTAWGVAFLLLSFALLVGAVLASPLGGRRLWLLQGAHGFAVFMYAAYLLAVVQSGVQEWRPFVFPLTALVSHAARTVDVYADARVRRAVRELGER